MLSPPLFPFESQAVLGLVCVWCKCRVGGEHLISGIGGAGLSGRGSLVDWLAQRGRGKRSLSASTRRCRSQVKVRRPRLPCIPLHPIGDFAALFSLVEGVSTQSAFQGIGMRAFLLGVHSRATGIIVSGLSWRKDPQRDTLPCGTESLKDTPGPEKAARWLVLPLSRNGQQVKLRF